jgi:hypothetical protein
MKRLIILLASISIALSGLLAGASAAHASTPIVQVCTPSESGTPCANRNGGGTGNGTPVIAWNYGDGHNDFTFYELYTYCGNGVVTATCPFHDTSIDHRYLGDTIYELFSYDTANCLAIPHDTPGSGYPGTYLEGCGAIGYVFVYSKLDYIISVGGTNGYSTIEWLTTYGKGNFLALSASAVDQWYCYGHGIGAC